MKQRDSTLSLLVAVKKNFLVGFAKKGLNIEQFHNFQKGLPGIREEKSKNDRYISQMYIDPITSFYILDFSCGPKFLKSFSHKKILEIGLH